MNAVAGTFAVANQSNLLAVMPRMYAGAISALLTALNQAGNSSGIASAVLLQKFFIKHLSGWEGDIPAIPTEDYIPYYT
ncbi:hypothetical protein KIPB_015574, partial [Kipferlia bialata]|eukprot:g15574.t1